MPVLIVTSAQPGDGKTAVAVGLAAALRQGGSTVRLVRAPAGDSAPTGNSAPAGAPAGNSAAADARAFAHLPGVRSAGSVAAIDGAALDTDVTFVEAATPEDVPALRQAAGDGAGVILVTRAADPHSAVLGRALATAAPTALLLTALWPRPNGDPTGDHTAAFAPLGLPLLATLPQDRLLAAPSIAAMAAAVDGDLSGPDHLYEEAVEWLQIGPISAHEGMDHFSRYPDKAVITRHDKIDVALAALDSEPACLILTGGAPSLPYVAQRTESEEFALIVTDLDTPRAVERIGALYGRGSLTGARKVRRAAQLMSERLDMPALRQAAAI